ncbi:unnamed protein product, partial [Mesorhabditis belari]|uniref:Uncharacterized protein n=1 Tax=Mesorhabditis belari TaxID=2138241 RepID=A0AAF3J636_9BILA
MELEDSSPRKTASPSLRRRAPLTSASPAIARKHVYFGGYSPIDRTKGPPSLEFEEVEGRFPPGIPGSSNEVASYGNHYASQEDLRRRKLENGHHGSFVKENRHITHVAIRDPSPSSSLNRRDNYGINGYERAEDVDPRLHGGPSSANHVDDSSLTRLRSQSLGDLLVNNEQQSIKRVSWEVRHGSRNPSGGGEGHQNGGGGHQNGGGGHQNGGSSSDSWAGSKLAGRVDENPRAHGVKNYWEENCRKEVLAKQDESRKPRQTYGFPKWRSTDALSASLVASNKVTIPTDSRIPKQRLQKMEETEKEASRTKQIIHEAVQPKRMSKGKSLESLSGQIQVDYTPWYDRTKIREGISRESIANIHAARQLFENGQPVDSKWVQLPSTGQRRSDGRSTGMASRAETPSNTQTPIPQRTQTNNRESYREIDYGMEPQTRSPQLPQSQATQVVYPSHHTTSVGISLTMEEQLLLLYLRQNSDMIAALGILIPDQIRAILDSIPWRRVELRGYEEETPHSYTPQGMSPSQRLPLQPSGRYVKNVSSQSNVPRFVKRVEGQRGQQRGFNEEPRAGEGLIAAEIRQTREREDELKRSRSELGLPSLEESMELWRLGQRGVGQIGSPTPPVISWNGQAMRGARSYDKLHQMPDNLTKTTSVDHLMRDDEYDYAETGLTEIILAISSFLWRLLFYSSFIVGLCERKVNLVDDIDMIASANMPVMAVMGSSAENETTTSIDDTTPPPEDETKPTTTSDDTATTATTITSKAGDQPISKSEALKSEKRPPWLWIGPLVVSILLIYSKVLMIVLLCVWRCRRRRSRQSSSITVKRRPQKVDQAMNSESTAGESATGKEGGGGF